LQFGDIANGKPVPESDTQYRPGLLESPVAFRVKAGG
jgi:hypothetical protein